MRGVDLDQIVLLRRTVFEISLGKSTEDFLSVRRDRRVSVRFMEWMQQFGKFLTTHVETYFPEPVRSVLSLGSFSERSTAPLRPEVVRELAATKLRLYSAHSAEPAAAFGDVEASAASVAVVDVALADPKELQAPAGLKLHRAPEELPAVAKPVTPPVRDLEFPADPDGMPVFRLRQHASLEGAALYEISRSLAGLRFQVNQMGDFFVPGLCDKEVAPFAGRQQFVDSRNSVLDRLTIGCAAHFRDSAHSLYTLSLQIFTDPARTSKFELDQLNLSIRQVSSGGARVLEANDAISGTLRFGSLETGVVYQFLLNAASEVPGRMVAEVNAEAASAR